MADKLYAKNGTEFPTHTTPHNQVVVASIPEPTQDTIDNYVALKNERDMSWDQVADGVEVQDPALAEYLRANGSKLEKADDTDEFAPTEVLTELAHNPLSTPEDRGENADKPKAAAGKK